MAEDKKENPELPKSREPKDPNSASGKQGGSVGKVRTNEAEKGGTRGG
ncbi:hypothetical protein J3D55_002730 [Chryseobacterium ginsenosidimutans]|nr:hypothetical protein [Chryseobacterium ginsenosidimutans]MCS3869814.1 hypothetical protein [Chryseobacterium ginsenosidimutans]